MNKSDLFKLNSRDFINGAFMAILGGLALPVLAAVQTPGFDIATVDLGAILNLAINGAIMGFATYISKNVFTAENGKLFGKI